MRHGVVVVCLAAWACASENELRYTATLDADTRGVVLTEEGDASVAAMSGTTCTIDPRWGCPVDDADLPTAEESVVDHHRGVTLGVSPRGLHQIDRDGWKRGSDLGIPAVATARLTEAGVAAVWNDGTRCAAVSGGEAYAAPDAACANLDVTVDRDAGVLYVATDEGVYALGRSEARQLLIEGSKPDLVSWDPKLGQLYAAVTGSDIVIAVDPQGKKVWATQLAGAIQSVETRGRLGELLVLLKGDDGLGTLDRLDGETGDELGSSTVPDGEGEVVTSDDGTTVAIVREDEVHFFELEPDGPRADEEDEGGDAPDCITPTRTVRD